MSIWDKIPENEKELEENIYYNKQNGKWVHNGLFWYPKVKNSFRSYYKERKDQGQNFPLYDLAEGKFQFESNCAQCHTLNYNKSSRGPQLRDIYNRRGRQTKGYRYTNSPNDRIYDLYTLLNFMVQPESFALCMGEPLSVVNTKQALSIIHYLMYLKTRAHNRENFVVDGDKNDYGNMYFPFRHKVYPNDYNEDEKNEMKKFLEETTQERIKKRQQWQEIYGNRTYTDQKIFNYNSSIFCFSFSCFFFNLSYLLSFLDFFYTNFSYSFL